MVRFNGRINLIIVDLVSKDKPLALLFNPAIISLYQPTPSFMVLQYFLTTLDFWEHYKLHSQSNLLCRLLPYNSKVVITVFFVFWFFKYLLILLGNQDLYCTDICITDSDLAATRKLRGQPDTALLFRNPARFSPTMLLSISVSSAILLILVMLPRTFWSLEQFWYWLHRANTGHRI